jgi:hypothetical protein
METELAKHTLWFPKERYEAAERAFLPSIAPQAITTSSNLMDMGFRRSL